MNGVELPRSDDVAAPPMLWRFLRLRGCRLDAADGDAGRVTDGWVDQASFTVRALVIESGPWLDRRHVLVSPRSIERVEPEDLRIITPLTVADVRGAPAVDPDQPPSAEAEAAASRHYGLPAWWPGQRRWGTTAVARATGAAPIGVARSSAPPALVALRALEGFGIRATDGELGEVEDVLVEAGTWAVRYVVVDPRRWWPGPSVLLAVDWITALDLRARVVVVDVTRDAVRRAPAYDPRGVTRREYESRLHGHYGRPPYWDRPVETWILPGRAA